MTENIVEIIQNNDVFIDIDSLVTELHNKNIDISAPILAKLIIPSIVNITTETGTKWALGWHTNTLTYIENSVKYIMITKSGTLVALYDNQFNFDHSLHDNAYKITLNDIIDIYFNYRNK